ncbi:MAG: hypothetical protein ACR2M3_06965 [Thermomicrobiales bacterium]
MSLIAENYSPSDVAPASVNLTDEAARRDRLWTASVFLFAAALFLLLASGHIYARDEETLYQMTDGIALHGEPLVSPDVWGIVESAAPSKHGLRPTSYGPGQTLLAVPWYWAGRAVSAFGGSAYAVYLSRFVVLTFNGFVTAATAALLFRLALAFGYRARVGVALAVCFGIATFALIQARTFFAEPLTALLVLLAFFLMRQAMSATTERRRALLLAGSGFVLASAFWVKIHAALFVPVLALYLTLMAFPTFRDVLAWRRWRTLLGRGAWWIGGFILPTAGLLLYDRWLYGNPFTTGYGDNPNLFTTPLKTGLYGLLYSSGKGIIWYAPPLLFALIGFTPFIRRFPRDGVAVLSAAAINVLFYARLQYWHGDGSWGPRYLLIVLPWLLLPALPVLNRLLVPGWGYAKTAARAGAGIVLLIGISVQFLAIAVSFDVPILTNTSEQARHFTPSQSPIVLSARIARSRFAAWWKEQHPAANTFLLAQGFASVEGGSATHFPRWTYGDAIVTLNPKDGAALHVKLTYFDHRPAAMRATATPVTVTIGMKTLAPVDRLPIATANEGFILAYDIPSAMLHAADMRLAIHTPTWNPEQAGISDRNEDLGIFVNNLELWADGVPMTAEEAVRFPPVPVTPRNVWFWSNYPEFPHLLDWWPVMLHDARLPGALAVGVSVGMLACIALLVGGAGFCLRVARRCVNAH